MEVGDLVRYPDDGDIGIVIGWDNVDCDYYVQWSDGRNGWHLESELEVIDDNQHRR